MSLRTLAAPGWRALHFIWASWIFWKARFGMFLAPEIRLIRASPLFDAEYYLNTYPDVRDARMDPAIHYLLHGWKEHRNPSGAFNTAIYLAANPELVATGRNPLIHHLRLGQKKSQLSSRTLSTVDNHDTAFTGPALSASAVDSQVKAIRDSGLFDEVFYLAMCQDLSPPPIDLIRHYCERGWREGRDPSDDFSTRFYLETYGDIRKAGMNPFWHYVGWGASESRDTMPDMSPRYEDDIRFGPVETDVKLLAFYATPNWVALRKGRPLFKGHAQPKVPSTELENYNPLDWRVLKRQAQMATRHGVYAFCFDLEVQPDKALGLQPIGQFLDHGEIDIRLCAKMAISPECLLEPAVNSLRRIFSDRRYVHVEDRPVLVVAVQNGWLGASAYLSQLRELLVEKGIGAPFLIDGSTGVDRPSFPSLGDAELNAPSVPVNHQDHPQFYPFKKNNVGTVPYAVVASNGVAQAERLKHSERPTYQTVSLARDNTAQNPHCPLVFTRFHIRDYRRWLDAAIANTREAHRDDRRFVFVNAWNDWNEGLYLEPDTSGGFCILNETTRALLDLEPGLRMPKVSVIVPNYNHGLYLRRRLDSVYRQTYKNIEVILLDDCSSDSSRRVLEDYAARYPEITRTFFNDRNSGGAFRQWAKGLKHATGELVWIAESDDFCDQEFLELLVPSFGDEAVLLSYGASIFVDQNETPLNSNDNFEAHIKELDGGSRWASPYVATAHDEVSSALGIKNTIPNASAVLFRRPLDMHLLNSEWWQSMRAAGDWVFYLHLIRGGKLAYQPAARSYFRRYDGSAAEVTYKQEVFYRELGIAGRTVAALYDVPDEILDRCRSCSRRAYLWHIPDGNLDEFERWYNYDSIVQARKHRSANIMVSTMGFYPGGAEILPIRMANELKRQGHSVLFFSCGLTVRQDGVRRLLRNDVPVVETSSIENARELIRAFGIEALNTHQWHMQKYPLQVPDVFDGLRAHVASLHGMIEHGEAFEATEDQLRGADSRVSTWVYTAEKNLGPFKKFGLYDKASGRFVKLPNGIQATQIVPVPRSQMNIPDDACVLCCVSRAIPDKGWAEAIEAVAVARTISGRDIRLLLVGNGPVYDEYCRLGTPEFVHLAGFSSNSIGYYASADLGIMLSKFKSESFPLTIVDCLFAGKPYIASDIGDIRNMLTVDDEVAGSIIKLENWEIPIRRAAQEIASFACDPQRYMNAEKLVAAAARRCRIDTVVSQYVELFEAERNRPLLGERSGSRNPAARVERGKRSGRGADRSG